MAQAVGVKGVDSALESAAVHRLKHGIVIMKAIHRKQRSGHSVARVRASTTRSAMVDFPDPGAPVMASSRPAIRAGEPFQREACNFTGIIVNFTQDALASKNGYRHRLFENPVLICLVA